MSRARLGFVLAMLLVIFALGLFSGLKLPRLTGFSRSLQLYNTATILKQVQTLSELITVKYVMEKVVVLEDVKWFGDNRVLMVAHAVVKAGVDLGQVQPADCQVTGKKIALRLPPARITDAYLDDTQTKVIERTTGLLRTFDKNLEQNARQQAIDDIRRSARNSGILKDADGRAQEQLTNLLKQLGFEEVEFQAN